MRKKFLSLLAVGLAAIGLHAQSVGDFITYDGVKYEVKSENLIANGSFTDGVTGWKAVNYTTDAVASNFNLYETGGVNNGAYLQCKTADGSGANTTPKQAVQVTPGKKYYFSAYTKGKAPDSNNFKYSGLYKMTNATVENGNAWMQFSWPQGAGKTSDTWNKTEHLVDIPEDNSIPYVAVRMAWCTSDFDEVSLVEVDLYFDTQALQDEIATANTQLATYDEDTAWYTFLATAIATAEAANPTDAAALNSVVATLQQAEADAAVLYTNAKNVEDFNYYRTNYNETVALGNWSTTGASQTNHSQHWDGTDSSTYLEPNQWGSPSVNWSGTQNVTLGAGKYVLMATGRSSEDATLTLAVLDGANELNSVVFPKAGSGKGVDTQGKAAFDTESTYANGGNGYGWQWRYVPFTLEEGKTVTLKFTATAPFTHQWASITAFELRAIPDAITYPLDMTYLVSSPSFENGKGNWTWNTAGDTNIMNNSGDYTIDNCNGSKLFNTWGGSAVKYVEQEIAGLPEGVYTLTAAIASDKGNHVTLYAGQSSVDCEMVAEKGHADDFSVVCVLPEGGVLKIGAKSTDWYKVDNFRLELTRAATAEDLATLLTEDDVNGLHEQANTIEAEHAIGFEKGEYAPYNNIDAVAAVAAAKAISVEGNNKTEYLAAKAALEAITWTVNTEEVNAIYNGNGFTAAHAGWNGGEVWTVEEGADNYEALGALVDNEGARHALYMRFDNNTGAWFNYGGNEGYSMPLKAGVTYTFSCDFAAWGVAGNPRVVLYDLTNGKNVANDRDFNAKRIDDGGVIYTHATYEFTPEKSGNVRLSFYMPGDANKGNLVISNLSITTATDAKESGFYAHNVVLTEETGYNNDVAYTAENVSLERTYNSKHADNWNTFCAPFDIEFDELGEGAEAAVLTSADGNALNFRSLESGDVLEAGKPYIVRKVANDLTAENVAMATKTTPIVVDGYTMTGIFAGTTLTSGEYFIKDNKFYYHDSNPINVKAFRAYVVAAPGAPQAIKRIVVDGELDGIATIVGDELIFDGDMYNVMGQKVDSNYKGLVIKNGQKFINK